MTLAWYIIIMIALVILGTVLLYQFFNKAGEKGAMEDVALTLEQKIDEGYLGAPTDLSGYIGAEGIALSVLRPSGKIKIDNKILDAVSYNDFIDEGECVKVIKYENAQLYVLKSGFAKDDNTID